MLKRIAEDRRNLQEKSQPEGSAETASPSATGQKLGGRVQTSVENHCILMVRGESCRPAKL